MDGPFLSARITSVTPSRMVAQTRQGNTPTVLKKLQFKDKLTVKGSTTDALLKKLLTLQTELASLEQEHVDVKSLAFIRKELIQVTILLHKDKGVKAYAACCLADLLRLYAPDAPYTADELRDIFQFFIRQLSTGLKGPEAPYYNQYFQLLESLSTVKSVVLLCDLPQADDLMTEVFREIFSIVRNNLAKNIELYMADILIALIDECQAVPHLVTELIMTQFAHVDHPSPSYRLAVEVCKATSDKLQRNVCQYFTDIIVQHSKQEEVLSEIQAAHLVIKQIHKDCPALLHNVIPQLEEELKVDQPELRLLATQILGEMFADKNGVEMVKKYPHVWETWQLRKLDKVAAVRVSFVDTCKGLIVHQPDLRQSVEDTLRIKLLDPDDKVRAATCKVYAQLDFETALHHVSMSQLKAISERTLDKKLNVRLDAMHALGRLYSNSKSDIEDNDQASIAQFAWIPNALLHAAHANTENMTLIEGIFWEYILPFPSKAEDEALWTDQLVTVMEYLDDRATNMLLNMSNLKQSRPTLYEKFVDFCEKYNGGVIDADEVGVTKRLNAIIQHLSSQFPDRTKAAEDLHAFAKVNENRLYKLLKLCMDTQVDLRTLIKTSVNSMSSCLARSYLLQNEFLRRVEQISPGIVSTMTIILRKATLWIINVSSVPWLLRRIKQADNPDRESTSIVRECSKVKIVLIFASKYCSSIFKPHIEDLKRSLEKENSAVVTEVTLRALIALGTEVDKETRDSIIKYSLSAHGKLTKFSARLIACWIDAEAVASNLVILMSEALPKVDPSTLVGHLAFLAEIVRVVPNAFEQRSDTIVSFIVQDLLMRSVPIDSNAIIMEEMDEWASDEEVSDLIVAKILGVKICRNRCLVHANSETALANASPVLTMLLNILAHGGSMEEDVADNPKVKSRIRLIAATSLLKMAAVPKFCERIMPHFTLLAVTLQDPCYQVRFNFLTKLVSYLSTNKTDVRFSIAVFLTAHDPEKEVKDRARAYVTLAANRQPIEQRLALFELNFLRLIYVLAHHPDFSVEMQNLKETAKYIEFYLDNIATPENISLLYHLTMKAKMVRDAMPEFTENLYCVSELAHEIIRNRAKLRNWQLNSYTRKVKVPSDIFKPLENSDAVNANLKKTYLPGDTSVWLQELGKATRSANVKPKARESNRKRKSNTAANAKQEDAEKNNDNSSMEDIDESSDSDAERSGSDEINTSSSESDVPEQDTKDELGRGARGRAKVWIVMSAYDDEIMNQKQKRAEHAARKQKRERR
ncbi:hypothetical protein Clacol_004781 [Clathrus columnatus]|uniref:Uncharacterized protein n=1 Tax=Clathrus columnatus TaxID=1419009 RepID=A0AAV5ACW7_9AGAM|nr:hypothetical protein Clacol_004781 [Clathrus columnatus]